MEYGNEVFKRRYCLLIISGLVVGSVLGVLCAIPASEKLRNEVETAQERWLVLDEAYDGLTSLRQEVYGRILEGDGR